MTSVVRYTNGLVVIVLLATLKYVDRLSGIAEHLNGPIVQFTQCLYFHVVPVDMVAPFASYVITEIFGNILRIVITVLFLCKQKKQK